MYSLAMEIDPNIYTYVNLLLKVLLVYAIIASPIVLTIILLYGYGSYKKWKEIEIKEHEKIIVGQANTIRKNDEDIRWQHEEQLRLSQSIEALRKTKKMLSDELEITDNSEADDSKEKKDLSSMNVKQLKALAKQRGLKMYSKKNKQQLITLLQE